VALHAYYAGQSRANPDDLEMKYEEAFARSHVLAKDCNDLFARKAKGVLSDEDFLEELPRLTERVKNFEKNIDPVLLDPSDYVTDLSGTPDPEDIVNPYEPNVIFAGQRWTANYLLMGMYGITFMFHIQVSMALRRPIDPDVPPKAYRVAQAFKAICAYAELKGPPGAIIEAQAGVAIASLFLPKDQKTTQWCRRTFAKIESAG
jgi:hypothetical protein